ncbi:hypothetical protein EHS19_10470, partial [Bifidobacterium jacchi]
MERPVIRRSSRRRRSGFWRSRVRIIRGDEGRGLGRAESGHRVRDVAQVEEQGRPDGRRAVGGRRGGGRGRVEASAGGERRIAQGERDPDDGVGFFRGQARPDTALKVAYIDAYRGRFGVGPICRVLSDALDCGFLTERGYRAFKTRPPSRMAARHEALVRDITMIREDEFMRVYGYRKVWHQLVRQGWDPKEIGRDQVARIMRGLG